MSGYHFDRLKILIIDDNAHMRKMMSVILQAFGVTAIFEACDGPGGWMKFRSCNPDMIFLDWMMPGMNGLEFTRLVRNAKDSHNPFIPIIMVTGYTQIEHVQRARDAGVTEFLAKPISAKSVLMRMTVATENPRSFVRTQNYFGPCRRRRSSEVYQGQERRTQLAQDNALAVAGTQRLGAA